jgi:hypothetical protein
MPGASARCQASFPIALKLFTKKFLIGSINRMRRHLLIQKPSQKHKNLTSESKRFRSPFFLCLIQILKAVAMGVVASIELFWPNTANPAIAAVWLLRRLCNCRFGSGTAAWAQKRCKMSARAPMIDSSRHNSFLRQRRRGWLQKHVYSTWGSKRLRLRMDINQIFQWN